MHRILCGWLLLFATLGTVSVAKAQLATQFTYNITAATTESGHAGVGFDGTHIWIALWASDFIRIFQPDGTLVETIQIPGLTGTRSLTWDGTHFWAAVNTTTLYRVDPGTRTVVSTITVPLQARYASFDPSADGGAGGFWIGNFSTDIVLVDLSGNTLQTLPAAGFPNLTGRYGIAYDDTSGPTPFLWVFAQTPPSNTTLGIIDLTDGTERAATQDLFAGTGLTSSLAGGLFLTEGVLPGQRSLLAMLQGSPDNILLGLEPAANVPVELQHFSVD